MYRKLTIVVIALILITGCTRITDNLDDVVNAVMKNDSIAVNTVSTGYELYIPTGVKQQVDSQYNQKLKIRDTYVYLYVDTVSYYYKNSLNYKSENDYSYYYKELELNNKTGYIGIDALDDGLYFCKVVYNYSKTEFYTYKNDLPMVLANVLMIQKSIKYNDNLIDIELANESDSGREIKYELDSPKDSESTFSEYLQIFEDDEPEEEVDTTLPVDD